MNVNPINSKANQRWGVNSSNNRRSYFNSKLLCNEHESNLPYGLAGSGPEEDIGNDWHWLAYSPREDQCLAVRPSRLEEGAAYFPCEYKFNFACVQRDWSDNTLDGNVGRGGGGGGGGNGQDRSPKLSLPKIQIVKNISQYNFEFQRQQCYTNNCGGGGGSWLPNYSSNNMNGGCGMNSCDRSFSGYSGFGSTGFTSGYNPYSNMGSNGYNSGCNSCNGFNNGRRFNNNYDYNYGSRGGGRRRGSNNYYDDYDYDYDDYDYDYDYGGGRRGGGGRGGVRGGGGSGVGVGGGGSRGGGGARRQKPSKFLQGRRQEIRPVAQSNPYVSMMGFN